VRSTPFNTISPFQTLSLTLPEKILGLSGKYMPNNIYF